MLTKMTHNKVFKNHLLSHITKRSVLTSNAELSGSILECKVYVEHAVALCVWPMLVLMF